MDVTEEFFDLFMITENGARISKQSCWSELTEDEKKRFGWRRCWSKIFLLKERNHAT